VRSYLAVGLALEIGGLWAMTDPSVISFAMPHIANQHPPRSQRRRVAAQEDRRQAILDAALDSFAEHGYSAARIEDVAARAGVAKGTIYLHFADKRSLFEALARNAAAPMLEHVGEMLRIDAPIHQLLAALVEQFREQVLRTRRAEVFRLVISESRRFPEIAEFYHREVISKLLPMLGALLARAHARGELRDDAAARFPHLLIAPLLLSVLWEGLFKLYEPLDTGALLAAHIELLTGLRKDAT